MYLRIFSGISVKVYWPRLPEMAFDAINFSFILSRFLELCLKEGPGKDPEATRGRGLG